MTNAPCKQIFWDLSSLAFPDSLNTTVPLTTLPIQNTAGHWLNEWFQLRSILGPVTCLVMGYWHDNGVRNEFHLTERHLDLIRFDQNMVGCYYDVHATIAQVVMCCQTSDCYSQSSQLGKTADWISPLVVWIAPSSTKKTGKEQASMPIPAWCLHILWVKYMVSLAITFYYCVLGGNRGHWQYLVMFGESMGLQLSTISKK